MAWLGSDEVTWELSTYLPPSLIAEFETGMTPGEEMSTNESYGVITHKLVTKSSIVLNTEQPPPPKVARREWTFEEGYATFVSILGRQLITLFI